VPEEIASPAVVYKRPLKFDNLLSYKVIPIDYVHKKKRRICEKTKMTAEEMFDSV
jgi:hypothetical protein